VKRIIMSYLFISPPLFSSSLFIDRKRRGNDNNNGKLT